MTAARFASTFRAQLNRGTASINAKPKAPTAAAVLEPLASAITNDSGGPFRAKRPFVMMGGSISSLIADFFHLSRDERKAWLVAGAAAGMTALSGAPVTAVRLPCNRCRSSCDPAVFCRLPPPRCQGAPRRRAMRAVIWVNALTAGAPGGGFAAQPMKERHRREVEVHLLP